MFPTSLTGSVWVLLPMANKIPEYLGLFSFRTASFTGQQADDFLDDTAWGLKTSRCFSGSHYWRLECHAPVARSTSHWKPMPVLSPWPCNDVPPMTTKMAIWQLSAFKVKVEIWGCPYSQPTQPVEQTVSLNGRAIPLIWVTYDERRNPRLRW